jgi:hypothetical protein
VALLFRKPEQRRKAHLEQSHMAPERLLLSGRTIKKGANHERMAKIRVCVGHSGLLCLLTHRPLDLRWFAFVQEQQALRQPLEVSGYTVELLRDTFENWQSEFLQLIWQVAGLSYLLYVGSEDKLDAILRKIDPEGAERLIHALDEKYPGRYTAV